MEKEKFVDSLSKINTVDDLLSAIPPAYVEQLGGGERGVRLFVSFLRALGTFSPDPAQFDQNAFSNLVAIDPQTFQPLSIEVIGVMVTIALETGLMTLVNDSDNVYSTNPKLQLFIKRFFQKK